MDQTATQVDSPMMPCAQPQDLAWLGGGDGLIDVIQTNLTSFKLHAISDTSMSYKQPDSFIGGIAYFCRENITPLSSFNPHIPWIFLVACDVGSLSGHPIHPRVTLELPTSIQRLKDALDQHCHSATLHNDHHEWALDPSRRTLKTPHGELMMTELEMKLFNALIGQHRPVSYTTLRATVWDYAPYTSLETMESAFTHMHRKVRKLGLTLLRPTYKKES